MSTRDWHTVQRKLVGFVCALGLAASLSIRAQAPVPGEEELLNSERIEQVYGSYGIEVVSSTPGLRVSRLYSTHDERQICRTFAVVVYTGEIDAAIAAEHAAVLDGSSIGATFAARGWGVRKAHRYFGEIESTPRLEALMGGIEPGRLAVHIYALSVGRDDRELDYASVVEVHHPDYLGLADLRRIYGDGNLPPVDETVLRLLELTAEQVR
ncbi:MAG TPA: hypothetical protein VLD39_11735 [Gammaproteobacteria bacterium]|nr:hypothetical protein [Gammaproteobacteria bacterium]